MKKGESKDYWLIKNAGILGGISKRRNREQSPTFFVTVNSIDVIAEKSREYGSQGAKDIVGSIGKELQDLGK